MRDTLCHFGDTVCHAIQGTMKHIELSPYALYVLFVPYVPFPSPPDIPSLAQTPD
jgi:hypothetical protein